MTQKDYSSTIIANLTTKEVFDRISRISDWWTKGFTGDSSQVGDRFTVRFGDTFVDFNIIEVIPHKRIVWHVTNCNLHWIQDKTEWKDTKIIWEVSSEDGTTRLSMTHLGLAPGIECYEDCKTGWNFYVGESLKKLLTENTGMPDGQRRVQSR